MIRTDELQIAKYQEQQIIDLVQVARTTEGYGGKTLSNGACVPLMLAIGGVVPIEKVSIGLLAHFQEELQRYLDLPNKAPLFPTPHKRGWYNHVYQEIMDKEAKGDLITTNLEIHEHADLISAIDLGGHIVVQIAHKNLELSPSGRPYTHAMIITNVLANRDVTIRGDLDPKLNNLLYHYMTNRYTNNTTGIVNISDLLLCAGTTLRALQQYDPSVESVFNLLTIKDS